MFSTLDYIFDFLFKFLRFLKSKGKQYLFHLNKAAMDEKHEFSCPWDDSDLILIVENQRLHVHRFILKMASPVFKAMLSSDFKEKNENELSLPGKHANQIVDLLRQIYPQFGSTITCELYVNFILEPLCPSNIHCAVLAQGPVVRRMVNSYPPVKSLSTG